MLFNQGLNVVESEKERNFYVKFFAGYLFNELIPGYGKRITEFVNILEKAEKINYGNDPFVIKFHDPHLTFDLHGYLFNSQSDRGELADIALFDEINSTCICIEAKWLEDWNFEKDVKSNHMRITGCLERKYSNIFQCLLIKRSAWANCKEKYNQSGSNYRALLDQHDIKLIVILWEDLIELAENKKVMDFFNQHLPRIKKSFKQYE